MCFKLMKVSDYLCGKADKTFITAKLVSLVVVIELVFCFKVLMACFTLKVSEECFGLHKRKFEWQVGES